MNNDLLYEWIATKLKYSRQQGNRELYNALCELQELIRGKTKMIENTGLLWNIYNTKKNGKESFMIISKDGELIGECSTMKELIELVKQK